MDRRMKKSSFSLRRCSHSKRALLVACLILCMVLFITPKRLIANEAEPRKNEIETIHICLSSNTFKGANRNDAQSAIKAWGKAIFDQRGIKADVQTNITDHIEDLSDALRTGKTDAAAMLTDEFHKIDVKPDTVYVTSRNKSLREQYVILVGNHSGIEKVSNLGRKRLVRFNHSRMCLSLPWLEILMAENAMGAAETEFAAISEIDNASRTVLQVFFRQADACLVTTDIFKISSEMNPQIGKELRVLVESPKVVSSLFFFRPGYVSNVREQLEAAIVSLNETPAGQQVLTVFQGDGMVKQPISYLEDSRQLLEAAERLRSHR
jgi:ABC-type phosphate/phosphonate transport system substrate-binding protein